MGLIIYLIGIFVGFLLISIQLNEGKLRVRDVIIVVLASSLIWVLVIIGYSIVITY